MNKINKLFPKNLSVFEFFSSLPNTMNFTNNIHLIQKKFIEDTTSLSAPEVKKLILSGCYEVT